MTVPLLRMEVKAFRPDDPVCPNTAPIDDGDTGPAKLLPVDRQDRSGGPNHTLSRIVTNSSRVNGRYRGQDFSFGRTPKIPFCGLSRKDQRLSATGWKTEACLRRDWKRRDLRLDMFERDCGKSEGSQLVLFLRFQHYLQENRVF